ncbi:hypothetical protein [Deinococcus budaensis]|uniref:Uncharacterized protein n=1 Tax=Deinococcus budaensis TaxID=1665626 RepID=A0A7W8GEF7_9DEIO|nr:hypothetical protein [Deinococcus budaensis]MBB5234117.1 hypothetical protein [Deinococcus budaensis]
MANWPNLVGFTVGVGLMYFTAFVGKFCEPYLKRQTTYVRLCDPALLILKTLRAGG